MIHDPWSSRNKMVLHFPKAKQEVYAVLRYGVYEGLLVFDLVSASPQPLHAAAAEPQYR